MPSYRQYTKDQTLDPKKLADLSSLAADLFEAQREVEELETQLANAKEKVRVLGEVTIPELMAEVGVEQLKTSSGITVKVASRVRASIPADMREAAYDWLDSHGHGGMVRREVKVGFRKEQEELASELLDELRPRFPDARWDRNVHHSTLAAWVRNMLKEGKEVPQGLFSLYEQRITKLEGMPS